MAFKAIEGSKASAINCDQKNKTVMGYLLETVNVYPAKKRGDQPTVIIQLQSTDKKGEVIRMFAPYAIRDAVLDKDMSVKKPFLKKLVRFTWLELHKFGKKSVNRFKIEVDSSKIAPKIKEQIPF